jgi:hypothetical protein
MSYPKPNGDSRRIVFCAYRGRVNGGTSDPYDEEAHWFMAMTPSLVERE